MIVKLVIFALVGIIGTLGHFSLLYALVEYYHVNPVWASGSGALFGLVINYILNYSLTFKSQQSHVRTFPRFALIGGIGMFLNLALMALITPFLFYLYTQIISTGIVFLWNFLANHFWTFRPIFPASER